VARARSPAGCGAGALRSVQRRERGVWDARGGWKPPRSFSGAAGWDASRFGDGPTILAGLAVCVALEAERSLRDACGLERVLS
jgi:hypothetical protein